MAESLLLDSYKNDSNKKRNSKDEGGFGVCPNAGLYAEMVVHLDDGDIIKRVLLGCNRWTCEVCSKKLAWKLRKKAVNGITDYLNEIKTNGFRDKYFCKFLTLTVPGAEYRKLKSPEEAEKDLKKSFNKLRTALVKKNGKFEYIWVNEKQKDGYPHLHVILMGHNISKKEILNDIKSLWCGRYGMGFVKINKVQGGVEQIANYISKYISKGMGENAKHYRVYSMSRHFRSLFKMEKIIITLIEFGRVAMLDDGTIQFSTIWEAPEHFSGFPDDVLTEFREDIEEEVHYQMELPFSGDWYMLNYWKRLPFRVALSISIKIA